jgi:sterol 24-C-methyltransferase
MPKIATQSKQPFWIYRLSTIVNSFKFLYSLSPEKLNAFLNSYMIFDQDWADEEGMIKELGVDYCNEVKKKTVDYYAVLNHLCSIGQVEKMYIPPAMDLSKSIIENQNLYERRVARDIGLKSDSRVLDIGCGRGRVANHMATHSGAHVTGINIDEDQLESARQYAQRKGMGHQCHFQTANLNTIPFPFEDGSFDAAYEIQALSYCKDLEKTFGEIHRLLKPGGRIACLDWVVLDAYDPKNGEHAAMMKEVKAVIGAVGNPTIAQYTEALKKAGFKILANENGSIDGLQAPLIEQADKFYTRLGKLLKMLCKCKILPAHFHTLFERLSRGGQDFVKADRMRLVSTSHYLLAEKV